MIFLRTIALAMAALVLGPLLCRGSGRCSVRPVDLRCEYLVNPNNIDVPAPDLSWKLAETRKGLRNLSQKSYRILVASEPGLLRKNLGDLWDSDTVESSNATQISFQGKPLGSRQKCYWKVMVSDQVGHWSAWSPVAEWKMALLHKTDWAGSQWIGVGTDDRTSSLMSRPFKPSDIKDTTLKSTHASPLLRHEFTIDKQIRNVTAYVCGLGYAELYVNGEKIGVSVLDPGQTNYDDFSLYATYDITKKIQKGRNCIGVMVGNGFYGQNIAFVDWLGYGKPCLRAKMWIQYRDGTFDSVCTGTAWNAATGPIQFDNVYGGESYDARLEKAGWDTPGYNDASWQRAKEVAPPNDSLRSEMVPPIKRMAIIRPKGITAGENGTWIVDLGRNIAGWARIRMKEKAGQQITMRFAENLSADGSALDFSSLGYGATGLIQTNIYVCRSSEKEVWEPRFTYAGFRYIELSGLTSKLDARSIEGVLVHTSVERRGGFISSDSLLNRMYDISRLSG